MIKKILQNALCWALLSATVHAKVTKNADEVFTKWREWQRIMPDQDIAKVGASLDDGYLKAFKNQYEKTVPLLAPVSPLLATLTSGYINEYGYVLRSPLSPDIKNTMSMIYQCAHNDMQGLVDFLKSTELFKNNIRSASENIEMNNALFQLLFAHPSEEVAGQLLFAVANRFFEYCFQEATFPAFEKMLLDKSAHPVSRMLYSVAWHNLAGNGWKHWHEDSLKALKEKADQGNQITYIAGGSDIYQLIKAGIYNIKNIDPQLPSQPKYYTNDWQFILKGDGQDHGVGDTIVFKFDDRVITMERVGMQYTGTAFKARIATGDVIELPHSITIWAIKDADGNKLGQYTLERRFCQQSDFATAPKKTILMSFNELYFIVLPQMFGGWGIETSKFAPDLSIVVKQLRKPVSKQMVSNMHIATLLNNTDFKFIALGTCIN